MQLTAFKLSAEEGLLYIEYFEGIIDNQGNNWGMYFTEP